MSLNVTVINGSPRGQYSTTLHSILYLQKLFKEDHFTIVEAATRIRSLENDLSPIIEAVRSADIILFAYPVYTFIVPAQLHRLIELLKESGIDLKGKYAAQITTSKHFYDVTAQKFIEENVQDMGMIYLRGLYADMDDLLTPKGRRQLTDFWKYIHFRYAQLNGLTTPDTTGCDAYDVAIVTDCKDNAPLQQMIDRFRQAFPGKTHIVNIADFPFKGGCISCFNCASDGTCIYKDGFSDFLKQEIYSADGIIYAFSVSNHSMGSRFKLFDDRQFCNGHRMMTIGTPVGYLIHGDLSAEANLRMILEARAEVGQNFLCDIIADSNRTDLDGAIRTMAEQMLFVLRNRTLLPQNFYGVGGTKIFRDLIWIMRGLMRADHKFYKSHGIYDDLPHRNIGRMLQVKLIGWLFNTPSIRRKIGNKMNEGMAQPYRKVIDQLDDSTHSAE